MILDTHSPNAMHTYKYAMVEMKIGAIEKILDESATLTAILNSRERAKKKPRQKDMALLVSAFDAYLVGMVEYPTVSQRISLSRADALVLMAKSDILEMYYGWIPIDSSLVDLAISEVERALIDLWDCYTRIEGKVVPIEKRRQ